MKPIFPERICVPKEIFYFASETTGHILNLDF